MEGAVGGTQKNKRKKRKRNVPKKQRRSDIAINEIFLDDFANAPDTKGALKKISKKMTSSSGPNYTYLPKLIGNLNMKSAESESLDRITSDDDCPWYERDDISDIEDDRPVSENTDIYQEEAVGRCVEATRDRPELPVLDQPGKCYPFDVWCLLARYVKPEQVQTFAGICRGANEAVNSVVFWIRLYRKFITDTACLPDRLKPDWIESRPGLKMRIVRALFVGYQNLRNQLLRESLEGSRNTETVSQLVGLSCCHMWYRSESSTKPNNSYIFYFKFNLRRNLMSSSDYSVFSMRHGEDYLTRNDESNFIIFQITVTNFILFKPIAGETLTDISVNLSRNMRYNCLKLVFHTFRRDGRYRKGDGTMIVLDPVCEFRLLRWWHPSYPHCDE